MWSISIYHFSSAYVPCLNNSFVQFIEEMPQCLIKILLAERLQEKICGPILFHYNQYYHHIFCSLILLPICLRFLNCNVSLKFGQVVSTGPNPEWDENFAWSFESPPKGQKLHISCKNKSKMGKVNFLKVSFVSLLWFPYESSKN